MDHRFKSLLFSISFLFLSLPFPSFAQVSDPILTDEPEQNHYEERKKQEIEKVVEETKNETATYGSDVLFYPSEFNLSFTGGLGYGSYVLKN